MTQRLLGPLALAMLVLAGCASLFDPAAAVVHGNKISVDEVAAGVDKFVETQEFERLSQQGDPKAITRQFEQGYLSQLIRRAVLAPKAEELEVEVTDEEVSARIDEIKNDFPSEGAFAEALKEQGLDEEQLSQLVRDSLLEEELRKEVTAAAQPTEAELREYYEAHEDDYVRTRVQHILVDNQNLADVVRNQIAGVPKKQQAKKFAELAKEFSTDDANAKKGGDLGFNAPGSFVPPFEEAMDKLDEGEVSPPVKTQFGWHVIRVMERDVQPFEEARAEIATSVSSETEERVWADWLAAAYEEAEIKVNPRYGELDIASGQVVDATAEDIPAGEEPDVTPTPTVPAGG